MATAGTNSSLRRYGDSPRSGSPPAGRCATPRRNGTSRDDSARPGRPATSARPDRAWQRAEGKVAQGYLGDPSRGRQTFRDYVENTRLPHHENEASTRQSHTYVLPIRILPEFREMQMMDILPEHVREWARMKAGE